MAGRPGSRFLGRVLSLVGRFVCIGCLVWFGLIVVRVVNAGMHTDPVAKEVRSVDESDVFGLEPGLWRFSGSDLSFKRSVQKSEVDLGTLPKPVPSNSTTDATSIVELAKSLGAGRAVGSSDTEWTASTADLQMRIVTSNSSPPMLLSAVIASKRSDGNWEVVELNPRTVGDTDSYLLPLPDDAIPSCSRVTNKGRLQMQLFTTAATNERLLDTWRDAGWDIERAPWGTAGGFAYLCSKSEAIVYAWTAPSVLGALRAPSSDDVADSSSRELGKTPIRDCEQTVLKHLGARRAPSTECASKIAPTDADGLRVTGAARRRTVMLTQMTPTTGANK